MRLYAINMASQRAAIVVQSNAIERAVLELAIAPSLMDGLQCRCDVVFESLRQLNETRMNLLAALSRIAHFLVLLRGLEFDVVHVVVQKVVQPGLDLCWQLFHLNAMMSELRQVMHSTHAAHPGIGQLAPRSTRATRHAGARATEPARERARPHARAYIGRHELLYEHHPLIQPVLFFVDCEHLGLPPRDLARIPVVVRRVEGPLVTIALVVHACVLVCVHHLLPVVDWIPGCPARRERQRAEQRRERRGSCRPPRPPVAWPRAAGGSRHGRLSATQEHPPAPRPLAGRARCRAVWHACQRAVSQMRPRRTRAFTSARARGPRSATRATGWAGGSGARAQGWGRAPGPLSRAAKGGGAGGQGECEQPTARAPPRRCRCRCRCCYIRRTLPWGFPQPRPRWPDRRAQVCARGREGVRGGTMLWVLRARAVREGTTWTRAVLRGTRWRRVARSATERAWDDG